MMIGYNVSDHWAEDEPAWVKSLVSSLDRHHGVSTVLPLTVAIEEITNWVELRAAPVPGGRSPTANLCVWT